MKTPILEDGTAVEGPPQKRVESRPTGLRSMTYLGFRATPQGREYRVQVQGAEEPRLFVLFIAHSTFASGEARFQDAPDLCYAKLRRELLADPELAPAAPLVVTPQELIDYRGEHRAPANRRRGPTG